MPLQFVSTGKYLPERIVTNREFEGTILKYYDKDGEVVKNKDGNELTALCKPDFIQTRMGALARRRARSDEYVHQMGEKALRNALEKAEMSPTKLDGIIVGSVTHEYRFASAACYIQQAIGATEAKDCYDISAGCTGFIAALRIADAIAARHRGTYAVIGVEKLSKLGIRDDVNMPLWGDGAGAAILSYGTGEKGIKATWLASDPFNGNLELIVNPKDHLVMADGKGVFRQAPKKLLQAIYSVAALAGWNVKHVKLVPSQANQRITDVVGKDDEVDPANVFSNIADYANMSAAAIPVALDEALEQKFIKAGDKAVFAGIGAGLIYGSIAAQF